MALMGKPGKSDGSLGYPYFRKPPLATTCFQIKGGYKARIPWDYDAGDKPAKIFCTWG